MPSPVYKIIAIDLDEVVVNTAEDILRHYNRNYGTELDLSDYYSHDYKNTWKTADVETAVKRVNSYLETPEYSKSEPIHMAVDVIGKLKQKYKLYIITGRPDFVEIATRKWIAKYFPKIFEDVVFSNFYDPSKHRHKGDICQELGVQLLIDDHLEHVLSVSKVGIDGILFGNFPWNQADRLPKNVIRARDWAEVESVLLYE
ncbi:MAG TPA: hypothetical protein VMT23_01455 [Candidatus Binatia bacterium]|nr:hypothetical protein [Candidatus Binatia bacterium]